MLAGVGGIPIRCQARQAHFASGHNSHEGLEHVEGGVTIAVVRIL